MNLEIFEITCTDADNQNPQVIGSYVAQSHSEAYDMFVLENFGNGCCGFTVEVRNGAWIVEF